MFIDLLDNIFAEPRYLCHLFVGVGTTGQQITGVLMQDFRNQMSICFKGYMLAFCSTTFGAAQLVVRKPQRTKVSADIKVPQIDIRACINVHPAATGTESFLLRDIKSPCKAINSPA